MPQKDSLLRLIHSMTKAEKRYFKIQASRHVKGNTNNYIRLFDLLEGMDVYEKTKIEKVFKGERFMNNLSAAKRYLFNAITESLLHFHSKNSKIKQLKREVDKVPLLIKRGLFKEANKIIVKVKKQAKKYQLYPLLYDILILERNMISSSKHKERIFANILDIYDEINITLNGLKRMNQLGKYHQQLHVIFNKQGLPTHEQKIAINAIGKLKIVNDSLQSTCFKSKVLALDILSKVAYYNNDMESNYQYYRQMYHLYRDHIWLDKPKQLMVRHNYLYRCVMTERYGEMKQILMEMQDFEGDNIDAESTFFECYYTPLLLYCRKTADFSMANTLIEEVDNGITQYQKQLKLPIKLNIISLTSVVLFIQGQYEEALDWINRLIDHPQKNVLIKIIPSSLILRLLIFLELEHYRLLEYQIRNTHRTLQNIDLYPLFCQSFLNFLKKMLQVQNSKDKIEALKTLHQELITIYPQETPAFGVFDFIDWAESKIQQLDMPTFIKCKLTTIP